MSFRVLPTASAGIFASDPYCLTCLSMSWISTASEGYVPSLILCWETYAITAGRGLPRTLYPEAFCSATFEAAAELAENSAIWLSGSARFKA